jgi:hypothetical protein
MHVFAQPDWIFLLALLFMARLRSGVQMGWSLAAQWWGNWVKQSLPKKGWSSLRNMPGAWRMHYHRYTGNKSAHQWTVKLSEALDESWLFFGIHRERFTVVWTIDALYLSVDRRSLDHYISMLACICTTSNKILSFDLHLCTWGAAGGCI